MNIKKYLPHILLILLIIAIGYFNIKQFNGITELPINDAVNTYSSRAASIRESILDHKQFFPRWQPYIMAGSPYNDGISTDLISYMGLLTFITPNPFMTTGLTYVLSYLLSGVSMYILALYLFKKKKYALLSALIFMLSGYPTSRFNEGTLQLSALSVLPIAFLFLIKTFKEKDWIKNAVITALVIALQIKIAPDLKVTLFTSLLFALFLLFQLIGGNIVSKIKKIVVVSLILLVIIGGLTAHSILPQKETVDNSVRAQLTYEQSSGRRTLLSKFFTTAIEPINKDMFKIRSTDRTDGNFKIGIIAFLLGIYGIVRKPNNKLILFLSATAILAISLVTASFVFYLLWRYIPPWDSFRYVSRAYVLWSFAFALLAGFGAKLLHRDISKKTNKKKANIAILVVIILVILNLAFFIKEPIEWDSCNMPYLLENADSLQYLSEKRDNQGEIFRVHDFETNGADWSTDGYTASLKHEHIFGQTAVWQLEYMNIYLSLPYRDFNRMSTLWGILNVKYITSRKPLQIPGFELEKQFERFESDGKCPPPNQSTWNDPNADATMKPFGEYLYKNTNSVPRTYITTGSILILGTHDNIMNVMYTILLSPNFDPKKTVLIHGKESIDKYEISELNKYSAIFFTANSVSANSMFKLQEYKKSGGILVPDIIENKNQITQQDINNLFINISGEYIPIPDNSVITKNFGHKFINLNSQPGFLVISEKYSMFEGWHAKNNKKELDIMRANGVVSTIYVDGTEDQIELEYVSKQFRIGRIISIITLLGIIAFYIFIKFGKKWKK